MGSAVAGLALCLAPGLAGGATNALWFAHSWQSDDGLPNNTISGVAQTSDGYLWLGTPSGLVRFDGIRFENFSPTNFVAPPNRGTIAMIRSRSGGLWLAMDRGGVVCLRGSASQAFTEGLPSAIPNGLAEDAEGTLWVAYRSGAVYRLKDGKASACAEQAGLPAGGEICALCSDKQGRVWFAKAGQCGTIQDAIFKTLHRFNPQPARLAGARAGGVWLCAGTRLFRSDGQAQLQDCGEFKAERGNTIPTTMIEDREGAVWIGTSFSGLFRHDDSGFEVIETTHQEILSLAEDREGNLWVGTAGGGVNRVRHRALTLEGLEAGLPFAAVQSICEDPAGIIWAATQDGAVARRTGRRWTALPLGKDWAGDATCLVADAEGALWIGTRQHGLCCWRGGQFVSWGDQSQIGSRTLHTVLASRCGDVWLGIDNPGALQRLRHGQLTTFRVPPDSRVIRAMAEDAAGNIWAGTAKGVLLRVTGEQLTEVKLRPSKESASIRCLYATPDGAVWLGYAGWGVGRFKDGRYAEIHAEDGLYDDYISHIVTDGHGWLWFGANRGVFKVRLQELEALAEGRVARVRSIHYGRDQGVPSVQGIFGSSPDVLRSRDGRLWLPMRTALVVVDPERLGEGPQAPPVWLERVTVDERTVAWYGGVLPPVKSPQGALLELGGTDTLLRVGPACRRLEFQFSAPTFAARESAQFRCKLEGYDEDWVEAGTERIAKYPRLSAGPYVFRVTPATAKACGAQPARACTWL